MKIQQFIERHSLFPMQFPSGWKPVMFLMDDDEPGSRASVEDRYEVYANEERTIWVSVNRTQQRFRICFCDLVNIYSDWRSTEMNYELEPIAAEPLRGA